jgi:membrane-bound acyltransferase YfiQ involved in biofilm formation
MLDYAYSIDYDNIMHSYILDKMIFWINLSISQEGEITLILSMVSFTCTSKFTGLKCKTDKVLVDVFAMARCRIYKISANV